MIDVKPLRIRLDKVAGFIRVYNGTRYLVLFGSEKYDSIYNGIRYLLGVLHMLFFYNNATINVDSYDYLSLEKTLT